ncbi:MAG: DUF2628 domain-containing protein [Bacilli bacterium]|nr:DUF2628 domain-containing protein [Bacilli bacterium]
MRCPKCNSRIDNTLEICNYCGERVKANSRNDQYEYSKAYSNVKKEYETPHDQQYGYSKTYSGNTKEYNTPHDGQYTYSQQYSNFDSTTITSDIDYIKAYIGDKTYKTITDPKTPLLIPALVFGPLYLFYRKLYIPAIISSILVNFCIFLTNSLLGPCLIINAIIAKISGKLLLDKATKKVEKIKNKNPDKDSRELLELCRKSGMPLRIGYIIMLIFVISSIIELIIAIYA